MAHPHPSGRTRCASVAHTVARLRGTRRELFNGSHGRLMQSSIINCSSGYKGGGFGSQKTSTLLAMNSVRCAPLEYRSSPIQIHRCHAPTQRLPARVPGTDCPRLHSGLRWWWVQ